MLPPFAPMAMAISSRQTPGVAGGMFREEGQHPVAVHDALGDGAPPVKPALDLALVEPDVVSAFFEVGLDLPDKLFVAVVAVAEEDAHRRERLGFRQLPVRRANPKLDVQEFQTIVLPP